ncbi:MAG: quinol:cytochrome C oxidoreductase [Sphingobacteriales bacterium 50-39]|nr:cytochrome c [Sphingobacteriales bacterium]OJW57205.1 MAG: quinol:cytochrome C oxidoreductase [Sphingobacteriales bacterium 50-39]
MKKVTILSIFVIAMAVIAGCGGVRRDPGRVYMPDMAYSRAYETYSVTDSMKEALAKQGIHFSNVPVPGTIKRGEIFPFLIGKDKDGDTVNYFASRAVRNPLTSFDTVEAERLYLVNCGICHGGKLDGNGPLYKGGDGPFPAKPATLVGDAKYETMPEGQMYYSVTYGKNKMGSYASQLSTHQRWMVIGYIKSKQGAGKSAGGSTAGADSTAKK